MKRATGTLMEIWRRIPEEIKHALQQGKEDGIDLEECIDVEVFGKKVNLGESKSMQKIYEKSIEGQVKKKLFDPKLPDALLTIPYGKSFQNLWRSDVRKHMIQNTYLAILKRMPTKDRVLRNESAESRRCQCRLRKLENQNHLFYKCETSNAVWSYMVTKYNSATRSRMNIRMTDIEKKHSLQLNRGKHQRLWTILVIIVFNTIWIIRNESIFNNGTYTMQVGTRTFDSIVKGIVEEDMKCLEESKMKEKWGEEGVLWKSEDQSRKRSW